MKKSFIVITFLISYLTSAQNVIIAENVHNGTSRDLNTGNIISRTLSAKIVITLDTKLVTLTVDNKDTTYNIDATIIDGKQTVLNCSNESQSIQLIYNDTNPTFITISEVDSDFAFFVDIIKHKNLKT